MGKALVSMFAGFGPNSRAIQNWHCRGRKVLAVVGIERGLPCTQIVVPDTIGPTAAAHKYIQFSRRAVEYGTETGAVGPALRTKIGWNSADAPP